MIHIFDNALLFNPCTGEWQSVSFSVENGIVMSVGARNHLSGDVVTDLNGARVVPGLIDTHVHIESTLLVPREFGRVVLSHGVTTAVARSEERRLGKEWLRRCSARRARDHQHKPHQ